MNTLYIDFSSLVIVPLVMLNREISTKEMEFYVVRVKTYCDINFSNVRFNLSKASKLFFELASFEWIEYKTNQEGETVYSFKDNVDDNIKRKLLNETSQDVLNVLTDNYVLEIFENKTKKLLNENK